ncbi:allantoate deiminase [Edaphobacter aggregans]|uniref:Allantoate deiminase n=1 Tax=Edaphobacter aggregans TaxID=570835 RepID=A0A428MFS3_9BACT|nr:allantoate amidohydrolase [Edaphobacter aggregans]RSL15746.1 allantoate deiminase [Edaphobacter aggregans]
MTTTNTQRAEKIITRCRQLAAFTEVPGETTRPFLSPSMHEVHTLLRQWMEAAGMTVHIDAIGNLRGLYPAITPNAPRLIIASHLDTVPNAGAFDGILGVVLGVTIIEELRNQHLPLAIEVIGFSEEEGVRFSKPFLGSLALIGKLDAETLTRTDTNGTTIAKTIRNFGLNPDDLHAATLSPETFAYLEFHIEQGPVLESESRPLGIVAAIAGQTRLQLTFTGQANHAGTTPMHLRHDAMAAAAEWITAVEAYATNAPSLVATVGKIEASPNAGNVIAETVIASLDIRHANDQIRTTAVASLLEAANTIANKRGVKIASHIHLDQPAVPMDAHLTHLLQTAATQAGLPSRTMTSGAGHDAMILAPHIPSTMLFLRSPGGISHHPDETVLPEDIEAALATAMEFLSILSEDISSTKEAHA